MAERKAPPSKRAPKRSRPSRPRETPAKYDPGADPRLLPARPDLAARHLAGKVTAARFVEGTIREVVAPQAPVRRTPSPDAPLDTEALKGELVTVYEITDEGWAWGQLADNYVGYLPASALDACGSPPTHRVAVPRTLVFPGPSIKLPPIETLSLGCGLAIARIEPPFAVTAANRYLPLRHLAGIATAERDFVTVAERFLDVPYLWGGKTSLGIDCSGLVQVALTAAGHACWRDSDMQERTLGRPVAIKSCISDLRRGDLLFWEGHVAIARNRATIIHANAFHMAVAIEPIAQAVRRIEAAGGRLRTIRRIPQ